MKDSDDYMDTFRRYRLYADTVEALGGVVDDFVTWVASNDREAAIFKEKLREMRESGSIPAYIGPRAVL